MKTILITGAAGNLGGAVVKRFLDDGMHVTAIVGKRDPKDFIQHKNLLSHSIDLLDQEAVESIISDTSSKGFEISAGVLLVGGFAMGGVKDTSNEDLKKMYDLNFITALNVVRPLLQHFEQQSQGGQFVFIGTKPSLKPDEGKIMMAYALSKSLVFNLSEFINASYPAGNITSHVVVPGTMDTPANRNSMPDADFNKWISTEKVADVIAFALSDTGKMLNESVIKIYNKV